MQFADVKNESVNLQLMWAKTLVTVPITSNVRDRIRTQLETALKGDKKPYQQAATFYYEWEKDYSKALDNVNKAIEANPKGFWLYLLKARIQNDNGDKAGAKASANKTIEVATDAKNADYVRMAKELLAKI
jgi:tetratricopeptide (TPR) repeat protein